MLRFDASAKRRAASRIRFHRSPAAGGFPARYFGPGNRADQPVADRRPVFVVTARSRISSSTARMTSFGDRTAPFCFQPHRFVLAAPRTNAGISQACSRPLGWVKRLHQRLQLDFDRRRRNNCRKRGVARCRGFHDLLVRLPKRDGTASAISRFTVRSRIGKSGSNFSSTASRRRARSIGLTIGFKSSSVAVLLERQATALRPRFLRRRHRGRVGL